MCPVKMLYFLDEKSTTYDVRKCMKASFLEIVIKEYEFNPLDCVSQNFRGAGVVAPSLPSPPTNNIL